jgi:hypothetical protein
VLRSSFPGTIPGEPYHNYSVPLSAYLRAVTYCFVIAYGKEFFYLGHELS